jgi:hypothetical protein
MAATFNSSAQVLSIGIFFTLMILGLAATLPSALLHGLTAQGVSSATATRVSHLPPVGSLFAAFLGYNPIEHLIGARTLARLTTAQQKVLLGHGFFPMLITGPFRTGLHAALDFAIVASALAAAASWTRGAMYVHNDPAAAPAAPVLDTESAESAAAYVGAPDPREP